MKKLILLGLVLASLLACTTSRQDTNSKNVDSKSLSSKGPAAKRKVALGNYDSHKGTAHGYDTPPVIKDALALSATELSRKYFPDSYVFTFANKGRDLEGLMMFSQNSKAPAALAEQIKTSVDLKADTSLSSNKDTIKRTMNMVVNVVAEQNVSGLQMQQEWWFKRRDASGREEFQYVTVYAIKKYLLDELIDAAISQVATQQDLGAADRSAIAELRAALSADGFDS